jgi:DNA-directed RNA polymerase specialized sigma24 family protein
MSASRPLQDAEAPSELTLGSLLYGDGNNVRVSEGAWVALVAAVAARDVRALQTLHGYVFTIALRITTRRSSAEEVAVDVFHDLWKRASSYSPADGTVVGWVMNLARSRAIDRLRYEKRKKRVASRRRKLIMMYLKSNPTWSSSDSKWRLSEARWLTWANKNLPRLSSRTSPTPHMPKWRTISVSHWAQSSRASGRVSRSCASR